MPKSTTNPQDASSDVSPMSSTAAKHSGEDSARAWQGEERTLLSENLARKRHLQVAKNEEESGWVNKRLPGSSSFFLEVVNRDQKANLPNVLLLICFDM